MKIKFLRIGITDNLKKANYSWVFLIKEICRLRFLFFEKVYVHTQKCPQLTFLQKPSRCKWILFFRIFTIPICRVKELQGHSPVMPCYRQPSPHPLLLKDLSIRHAGNSYLKKSQWLRRSPSQFEEKSKVFKANQFPYHGHHFTEVNPPNQEYFIERSFLVSWSS